MASDDDDTDEEQKAAGPGFQADVLKSYLAFAKRAIGRRKYWSMLIVVVGTALTLTVLRYFPRTYNCTTVMMGEGNQVLGDWQPQPFSGAVNLIMRKENLESLVREAGLVKTFEVRKPPLLRKKDELMQSIFGKWDDSLKELMLLGVLESRLTVSTDGPTMTVSVNWTDGQTAAEVAEAARQSFLKTRRNAEVAAFTEKMAIFEGHATRLRDEIEQLAEQIRPKAAEPKEEPAAAPAASGSAAPPRPVVAQRVVRRTEVAPDPELPARRQQLDTMKRKLADLEGDRDRRVRDERGKLAELRLRLAPSHPDVLTSEQRIAMLAQEPSEMALLRAEVQSLEREIQQRDSMTNLGTTVFRSASPTAAGGTPDPLPRAITDLLTEEKADPAMLAQLSGAVARYGALRDQLRSGRIDIDTAQAAFNQRYRVLVPAEAPSQPFKPKPLPILGGGIIAALFIALLVPLLAELRTGIIVERWQVQHLQIPVLAELKLPPGSDT